MTLDNPPPKRQKTTDPLPLLVSPIHVIPQAKSPSKTPKTPKTPFPPPLVPVTVTVTVEPTQNQQLKPIDVADETVPTIKTGDRLEVMWDLEEDVITSSPVFEQVEKSSRWWGATLLPPSDPVETHLLTDPENGDTALMVVRVLDYDPYPEGGYPESSPTKIVFVADNLIYDLDCEESCVFRREGEEYEPPLNSVDPINNPVPSSTPEVLFEASLDGATSLIDGMLSSAIASVMSKFEKVDAARQAVIGEIIGESRQTMIEALLKKMNVMKSDGVDSLTQEHIGEIMAEIGPTLATLKDRALSSYNGSSCN